jgi:hypothetical protein
MYIYIDESGPFVTFPEARNSVSCVTALVIPESVHDQLLHQFAQLKRQWGFADDEVKGSLLTEPQFDAVIRAVYNTQSAFIRITAIDMGLHTVAMIKEHQTKQSDLLRKSMDDRFHPELVKQVYALADQINGLAPQLYVQSAMLTKLILSVIRTGTLLYSQLEPPALGRFTWAIDAKNHDITPSEILWKTLVLPFLQDESLKRGVIFLREGDYSYFAQFENPDLPSVPDHLREAVHHPDKPLSSFSVNLVLADLRFLDSRSNLGLQLVDVLANCFRRAANNRLQPAGWNRLGNIIVRDPRTNLTLEMLTLSDAIERFYPCKDMPYRGILDHIARNSRGCLIRKRE